MTNFVQAYDTENSFYFVNIDEIKTIRPCQNGDGAWIVLKGNTERSLYVVRETYKKMHDKMCDNFITDL